LCDGTATAIPNGQTPFTYSWNTSPLQTSQSISALCPGTYIVFCTDANSCVSKDTVTINSPTALSISVTTTPTCFGCNAGSANATVSGGTPPYFYYWSPPASIGQGTANPTNLPCGTYTCTLTDMNGCTASTTFIIFCCGVTTTSTPNCYNDLSCANANGTATAIPTGQAPFIYSWNTNPVQTTQTATGLCAGFYTVTVTDGNNCVSSDTVRVNPQISISTFSTASSNSDGSAYVNIDSGATFPVTYIWYPVPGAGQGTDSIWGLCPLTYTICVQDANCISCDSAIVSFTTSITNITESNFIIFPNPSNGSFYIKNENKRIKEITIFNMLGESIYRKQNLNENGIQINKLAKGIYTIYIIDEKDFIVTEKIVIH